jgi:hypothetical protein
MPDSVSRCVGLDSIGLAYSNLVIFAQSTRAYQNHALPQALNERKNYGYQGKEQRSTSVYRSL